MKFMCNDALLWNPDPSPIWKHLFIPLLSTLKVLLLNGGGDGVELVYKELASCLNSINIWRVLNALVPPGIA